MSKIVISDLKVFGAKKQKLVEQGLENLHVLADFDRTLTKAFVDGEKVPSVISRLRDGDYISKDYAAKAKALAEQYYPIEIDPNISDEERKTKMHEWWTAHFELLIRSGLNKKHLEQIVEEGKIQFRKGALEFIDFLHENNVPLVIMSSSGVGDTISMFLKKQGRLYDNVHIITNSYEWDENGNAARVKEPIIHVANKGEIVIRDYPVFDEIKNRRNVILLGDSLGDAEMVGGFDYENLIRIGFLNEKVEESLDRFSQAFDIVLTEDADFDYVNKLVWGIK